MTPEAVKQFSKALSVVAVLVGGFGSILCVPFALTNNLYLIATAGIYFVAGGIMITGGLISFAVLNKQ
jgi:hypothetical protein